MDFFDDYSHSNSGCGSILLCILLIIVLGMVSSCSDDVHVSSARNDSNMAYISEGYCYDTNTKIIYREYIVDGGRYGHDTPTYTPYINENGNYCKYEYGKWVEFVKTP